MKNAVKKYLEEAILTDAALAEKYDETKLEDCFDYINEEARKKAERVEKGSCTLVAAIREEEVYAWARHFFIDVAPDGATKGDRGNISGDAEDVRDDENKMLKKASLAEQNGNPYQLDLFGGLQ